MPLDIDDPTAFESLLRRAWLLGTFDAIRRRLADLDEAQPDGRLVLVRVGTAFRWVLFAPDGGRWVPVSSGVIRADRGPVDDAPFAHAAA